MQHFVYDAELKFLQSVKCKLYTQIIFMKTCTYVKSVKCLHLPTKWGLNVNMTLDNTATFIVAQEQSVNVSVPGQIGLLWGAASIFSSFLFVCFFPFDYTAEYHWTPRKKKQKTKTKCLCRCHILKVLWKGELPLWHTAQKHNNDTKKTPHGWWQCDDLTHAEAAVKETHWCEL